MIMHLNKRRIIFCLVTGLIIIAFLSCKEKSRDPINTKLGGKSILDIEYINDTLDINLVDFRITNLEQGDKRLEIFVITDQPEEYSHGYRYFVHFYPKITSEADQKFISLGTKSIDSLDGVLVYSRDFKIDPTYFELVRYGLLNKEGKRLFVLTLDSVNIE